MNQLVVLQEIYAALSKGGDGLQKIDIKAIEGSNPELVVKLLESARLGRIDGDICRKLSLKLQDVYELKRMGDICRRAGLPDLAANTYNKALSLCNDPVLRPVLQNNLGQAFVSQGDLAKAVFYYQKAAESFIKEGDQIGLAHVLGNLGSAYRKSAEWDKAIEHCYRSLKTFEEEGDELGIAQMTGSLGRAYADMGEMELAARYFERSLADFERLGDKRSSAWVMDRLGRIAGQRMDWDRALYYFNSSLSLFEALGESQSQGIVLSNLGCIYLKMGQPAAAREPLERALGFTQHQMKPGYQNALYCLAKTYSSLARDKLQEPVQGSISQRANEASWLFIQAANRYHELLSTLGEGQEEVKEAEAIAISQSYLAKSAVSVQPEEALIQLGKAQEFLDSAAENASYEDKPKIVDLQRIVAGMKEIHRSELLADEPLKQARAMNNALEYLMAAVQACPSEQAGDYLYQALKNINASLDLQRLGRESTEKLQIAAEALRHAEKHFSLREIDGLESSADRIEKAAEVLEGSTANENRPCQEALLLIANVMASNSLSKIDNSNSILAWDESLHLLSKRETGEFAVNIKINDLHEPDVQPIADADLPVLEVPKERHEARDLILADGSLVPLETEIACNNCTQRLVPPSRQEFCYEKKMPQEPEESMHEPQEEAPKDVRSEEYEEIKDKERYEEIKDEEKTDNENNDRTDYLQAAKAPEIENESQKSFPGSIKGIFLLKIMTALVVMLLAIEAIIHFI
ncbi:MAG: photosystem I assembly protein Ycf3 [Methanosaeta sp. PtaU1.Bin112]|nr:MAG: photosystem I assembly protein Ycf3 [Methanosaeta sp. PtaU1.Bin112]